MPLQRSRDRVDHLCRGQHPDLAGADRKILEQGIDLRIEKRRRWRVDGADAARVLRGQGGDGGQAVHAMCGEGLEIGLNAGAAAGIGAGNAQDRRRLLIVLLFQRNIPCKYPGGFAENPHSVTKIL